MMSHAPTRSAVVPFGLSVVVPALSVVVPAKAGTHNPQPSGVPTAVPHRFAAACGSPPSRGRQLRIAAPIIPISAIALFGMTIAGSVQAQDYPNRPITLVVPYGAGGGNDLFARIASEKMSRTLGQQIVIENRPGAGGSTATRAVAKAAPDGYTLVIGGTGTLAVNPTLYQNVGYDPRKDFAPVGLIGTSALVVLVNPNLPARSIPELIALAKK